MGFDPGKRNAVILAFLSLILLTILIAGNIGSLENILVYLVMLLITIFAYQSKFIKKGLFEINFDKSIIISIVNAIVLGLVFYGITKVIPGFTIGLPNIPQSIGSTVRGVIILVFAPIVESFFFQNVVYSALLNINRTFAFIGQGIMFSLAHVSAYILGFYNLSGVQAITSLGANTGAFISAFIFAEVGMFFLLRKNINNLAFIIILHGILNAIILTSLTVIFI